MLLLPAPKNNYLLSATAQPLAPILFTMLFFLILKRMEIIERFGSLICNRFAHVSHCEGQSSREHGDLQIYYKKEFLCLFAPLPFWVKQNPTKAHSQNDYFFSLGFRPYKILVSINGFIINW